MQDIHTIGGGGAPFFGGGGDRRLRPNHQHNIQTLKCPRCDSINTKFCYYNNYNLSQPRHFCKSCRRYWTKGGVLRNVPVGGGCRKSKRSKPKSNTTTTTVVVVDGSEEPKSNSHSSSESSSLTATTTAAAANNTGTTSSTAAAAEVVSASSSNVSSSMFLNFSESNFFVPNSTNNTFDHHHHHSPLIDHTTEGQMFQDIGNFTNLITPSNDPGSFNMAEIPGWNHQQSKMMETDHVKMEQMGSGSGFMSQMSHVELSGLQQNKVNNSELGALDWQIGGVGGEHGLYDLTGTVDQTYWSQTQWGENDQSLNYLP